MVVDDGAERVEDRIRVLLTVNVIVIVLRDGSNADDYVGIAYLRPQKERK